jgi:tetratricopeptide (TPR) repeat protein
MKLREMTELLKSGEFDKVLEVLSGIEKDRPLAPRQLVLRGRCIQLASGADVPDLKEAEQSFQRALELDDEYVPALLELAWFYHAVEDDAAKALPFFERAYELSRQDLTEAVAGKVDCLDETESQEAASAFLNQAIREAVRIEDLEDEKQAWIT